MNKSTTLLTAALICAAAAVIFSPAQAAGALDPPPPEARVTAPDISGVNPDVALSEGHEGEIPPSGIVSSQALPVPLGVDPPAFVAVSQPAAVNSRPQTDPLAVPLRTQDPADVTCGAAALGMALDQAALTAGEKAPAAEALIAGLRSAGMLYEGVGTGAEELAYLARQHGYRGSFAFHGWTLGQLKTQLAQGRAPVAALGANGEGQPGHFVTVTGISEDGAWVSYHDPVLGKKTVPAADFQRLWGAQGNSGMVALRRPLSPAADPMLPWMGMLGSLSMLAVLVGQEGSRRALTDPYRKLRRMLSTPHRKGLGGRLQAGKAGEGQTLRMSRYETHTIRKGWKTVEKQVPVYETRKIKVGSREVSRVVPQYKRVKIQVGTRPVSKKVPRYVWKKVQTGTRTATETVRVKRWRKKVSWKWKRIQKRVPVYRDYGPFRRRVGTKTVYRWKKVRQVRRVPHWTTRKVTREVPVYQDVRVQQGTRTVTEEIPVYGWQRKQVGWQTVTEQVPVYEDREVRVGTKTVTERVPNFEMVQVPEDWKEIPVYDPPPPEPTPDNLNDMVFMEGKLNQVEKKTLKPYWDYEMKFIIRNNEKSWLEKWKDAISIIFQKSNSTSINKFDENYQYPHHNYDPNVYSEANRKLGLEKTGRKKIDDWFNPYYYTDPQTGVVYDKPSFVMKDAANILYGNEINDFVQYACKYDSCNNPLRYQNIGDDPIDGLMEKDAPRECNLEMAYMVSRNQVPYRLFLEELGADIYEPWNYDPNWLNELMAENPNSVQSAYRRFIDLYEANPEILELYENSGAIGPNYED